MLLLEGDGAAREELVAARVLATAIGVVLGRALSTVDVGDAAEAEGWWGH